MFTSSEQIVRPGGMYNKDFIERKKIIFYLNIQFIWVPRLFSFGKQSSKIDFVVAVSGSSQGSLCAPAPLFVPLVRPLKPDFNRV